MLAALFAAGILFFCGKTLSVKALFETKDVRNIYVRLSYCGTVWEFRYPEIVYRGGFDEGLNESFEKDFRGRLKGQKKPFACAYELRDAENKFKAVARHIDKEPVNAEIRFNPCSQNMFIIKDDVKGKKLDVEGLLRLTADKLSKGESVDINIEPHSVNAAVTRESLEKALYQRCEFSTDFSGSSPERRHNIALSLKQFNGMIVPPGGTVSFNSVVGPRKEERGYKVSKIISNGEFIEGVGGGVCQTSTTLYNALILADIRINEYHRHTLSVSYVPPSFDAMVNISTADLKFTNDSGNFLFFKTWTDGSRAYVRIYGEKMGYTIKRRSTVIKEYETPKEEVIYDIEGKYPDIYEGERRIVINSKPKKETMGELLYYREGRLFKTVILRKDVYLQLVGKEIIGTAKRPAGR
jgi:vancomycin resistance protein YoaR